MTMPDPPCFVFRNVPVPAEEDGPDGAPECAVIQLVVAWRPVGPEPPSKRRDCWALIDAGDLRAEGRGLLEEPCPGEVRGVNPTWSTNWTQQSRKYAYQHGV